jgi:PAS domain S-box-containing protein
MDIRTKLVFALVAVSLSSMLSLGVIMYVRVEAELGNQTLDRLEGLAEFKREAVNGVVAGWHDRVSLVASRTQLRSSLSEYNTNRDAVALGRIEAVLADVLEASSLFTHLRVHASDGSLVAEVGSDSGRLSAELSEYAPSAGDTEYYGVMFDRGGPVTVAFSAPLTLDGQGLGYLHAILRADEIVTLSANYRGLGETGETMVVAEDREGVMRVLHPVRAPPEERPDVAGLQVRRDGPGGRALRGEEAPLDEGLTDYRGEVVWAAIRGVPATGWGVVVKVDVAEWRQPIADFRADMTRLAIALSAFAILAGTILGFRFAQPIHLLAEAANRIRAGDLQARSNVQQEDEVGLLARTFDEMATSLEEQVTLLTEFRRFFDMSLDMMCIASTDGYFKRVNPAFVRELGWSEEDLLKRPFLDLVHEEDSGATLAEIEKLSTGAPTISFENRFLCMDGTYKRLRWNSYPDEESGLLYAIARVRAPKRGEPS